MRKERYNIRRFTYNALPLSILALKIVSGVFAKATSDELRYWRLWLVGPSICKVMAGQSVDLGFDDSELDARVVIKSVRPVGLNSEIKSVNRDFNIFSRYRSNRINNISYLGRGAPISQSFHIQFLEIARVSRSLVRSFVVCPTLCNYSQQKKLLEALQYLIFIHRDF